MKNGDKINSIAEQMTNFSSEIKLDTRYNAKFVCTN